MVNSGKTNLLCISDALNHRPAAYIEDSDGQVIKFGKTMKVLGYTFSDRPNVAAHVKDTVKKTRMRYWILTNLKKIGFTREELVAVYKNSVLPIPEYCAPVYHSLMTDVQDQEMERAQVGALRAIYGYGDSARTLRQKSDLRTLREQRVALSDNFANKCLENLRFKGWFPLKTGRRSARSGELYQEFPAKNDRLANSPLYFMRRRLNGKEGKKYGERNRVYRENFAVE